MLSNLGLGFDYVVMALAPTLNWLLLGRTISGVTAASLTTAGAYRRCHAAGETRGGIRHAERGVRRRLVLGPAVGGLLGGFNGDFRSWWPQLGVANALYGTFVLPRIAAAGNARRESHGNVLTRSAR